MNRATTKEEYKAFMRKWRAVISNVNPPEGSWRHDKEVQSSARNTAFGAVYDIVPCEFWHFRRDFFRFIYSARESCGLMLNVKYAANSHPHETRNP